MPKSPPISDEEKKFVKEIFDFFEYAEQRGLIANWKKTLAEYIYSERGGNVKMSSIIRNINRMIAYYKETGAQARSGKEYLPYIYKYVDKLKNSFELMGATPTQYFVTVSDAKLYAGEIPVLHIFPDVETQSIVVLRYYMP